LFYVEAILRWIHILSAIVLLGGLVFWRVSLLPASREHPGGGDVLAAARRRWARVVAIAVGLLLLGGIVNLILIIKKYDLKAMDISYHALIGVKVLLALVVFFLASLLAGKTSAAEKLRQKESLWLDVTIGLAVAVVCIAGVLKTATKVPKDPKEVTPPPAAMQQEPSEFRRVV